MVKMKKKNMPDNKNRLWRDGTLIPRMVSTHAATREVLYHLHTTEETLRATVTPAVGNFVSNVSARGRSLCVLRSLSNELLQL